MGQLVENVRRGILTHDRSHQYLWSKLLPDRLERGLNRLNVVKQKLQGVGPSSTVKPYAFQGFTPPGPQEVPSLTVEEPTPLPDEDAIARQRRRAVAQQAGRGGRASTIFSQGEGLGG